MIILIMIPNQPKNRSHFGKKSKWLSVERAKRNKTVCFDTHP